MSFVLLRDMSVTEDIRVVAAEVVFASRALEVVTRSTLTDLEVDSLTLGEAVPVDKRTLEALVTEVVPGGNGVPNARESTEGNSSSGDSSGRGFPNGTGYRASIFKSQRGGGYAGYLHEVAKCSRFIFYVLECPVLARLADDERCVALELKGLKAPLIAATYLKLSLG